ncbi:hypothetical protein scyTo_0002873 [Scyliorhinus torazame]|uniref:Neurofascin/L1/NrCAM C-terminal domain-containing protein n=1 Tax=Scyliorhinus torazame TaxID=75743 RepID=A0A401PL29_SCYTO|nr:hypothetical protein [Scyliorhinus torazame]
MSPPSSILFLIHSTNGKHRSLESDNEDSKKPQGSQSSVDGTVKQEESDDSIVIYGDGDGNSRFGEDGSFIGQYTVKKDKEETEGNDSSEATSPVNPPYPLAQM